jgi:hypothetical protein
MPAYYRYERAPGRKAGGKKLGAGPDDDDAAAEGHAESLAAMGVSWENLGEYLSMMDTEEMTDSLDGKKRLELLRRGLQPRKMNVTPEELVAELAAKVRRVSIHSAIGSRGGVGGWRRRGAAGRMGCGADGAALGVRGRAFSAPAIPRPGS